MPAQDEQDWLGFRELDQAEGLPKGSAFKAFKALRHTFREGTDFQWIRHGQEPERVDRLRHEGRIYQSSVNVVLVNATVAEQIQATMRESGSGNAFSSRI